MSTVDFQPVAKTSEIPDPGQLLVEVEDRLIVLTHVDGQFYAIDDVCTHDGGPLSDGVLSDHTIACPRHGAKFDIRTGAALTMPATQATEAHEVKVEGDDIFVKLGVRTESESAPSLGLQPAKTEKSTESASESAQSPASPEASQVGNVLGALSEDHVREALKQVIDPELFVNIVDLGLIYVVDLKDAEAEEDKFDVTVEMTMTSPACPAGPQLMANSKEVVNRIEQVNEVEIKLVMQPPWTPDRMTEDAKDQLGIF